MFFKQKSAYWLMGLVSSISVFGSTFLAFNPMVKAQVGVSPLVIQVKAERGQAQGIITIKNTTNQPSRVRIYTEPFTYQREEGFTILTEDQQDLSPYLRFSPREMTIPPNAERRVRLLAQLLPSLPDQEYRTTVFAETLTETVDEQQNTVGIIARIGVTVYVHKGTLNPTFAVQTVSYAPESKDIQLLVANTGSATVLPKLTWKLSQNGQVVGEGELPETAIIAGGDRLLKITPTINLTNGNYQLTGELIWQIDNGNPNTSPFSLNFSI